MNKTEIEFSLGWLEKLTKKELQVVLLEYRHFVRRFVPWVALVMARTEDNRVRQFLVKNIFEECGVMEEESHLDLLDKVIRDTGFNENISSYKPSKKTVKVENWFINTFNGKNTYKSLCVLGPSTESISHLFLAPLKDALQKVFKGEKIDYEYFDIHLSEIEREHAQNCGEALSLLESEDVQLIENKEKYIKQGLEHHSKFWKNLKLKF